MNINVVYECDIYRLVDTKCKIDIKNNINGKYEYYTDNYGMANKYELIKKALVYYSILQGGFIDMETGQFYKLGYPSVKGELFVSVHKSKKYGKDIMGTNRHFYSKRKILKKYIEYKEGENCECK